METLKVLAAVSLTCGLITACATAPPPTDANAEYRTRIAPIKCAFEGKPQVKADGETVLVGVMTCGDLLDINDRVEEIRRERKERERKAKPKAQL